MLIKKFFTKKFINYKSYNIYINYNKYKMVKKEKADYGKITTIAIPLKIKEGIQEYGMKGESYADILERLLKSARERMISDVLMNDEGCISIEEAIAEAEKKWPR